MMGFPDQPSEHQPGIFDQPTITGQQAGGYGPPAGGFGQPGGYPPAGYQAGAPTWTAAPGFNQAVPSNNGMAIASLICGVMQFFLWFAVLIPGFIAALLALAFGVVSLRQMAARGQGGRGMAVARIVLGGLGVFGGIVLGLLIAIGIHASHTSP